MKNEALYFDIDFLNKVLRNEYFKFLKLMKNLFFFGFKPCFFTVIIIIGHFQLKVSYIVKYLYPLKKTTIDSLHGIYQTYFILRELCLI